MGARVVSVNVGPVVEGEWAGRLRRTAIDKQPVGRPVRVGRLGLTGDEIADTEFHGGTYKAVYAYAEEDLAFWAGELGEPLAPGFFGENLTTAGIDVNAAVVGEHWRVGTALLQPIDVRIPCRVFKNWVGRHGMDDAAWQKRFTLEGRPGPYLRVLEEGEVRAGDPVVLEHRPAHGVSIATMFRALTTEPDLLPTLLGVEGLDPALVAHLRRRTSRSADETSR
jgi:MOSC domain-containing protein YiiM